MEVKNNKLEIIIETKELFHALTFANSIVEKRNIIAELGNIKLSAKDGSLNIIATDMDLTLRQQLGAQVFEEGETTISTTLFNDIVRKISDKEIKLKQVIGSDELELIGKNCHFKLLTLPADQFPEMDELNAGSVLTIPCRDFARILDYTQFSMSTEETRYNLNGIYLHVKGDNFYAAATDGHRLSVTSVSVNSPKDFGVIIPKKTVQEISKLVKDSKNIQGDIEISLGLNKIKFTSNNITMVSKLIDGTFPEYDGFIPVSNMNKLIISTKLLADAIERVATVTVDKFRAIKINLTNDFIEITASGEAKGAAIERLEYSQDQSNFCEFDSNVDLSIGFNPKYLSDVLSAVKQNQVELYFNDPFSPVLIKVTDSPTDNFVVMPVKV